MSSLNRKVQWFFWANWKILIGNIKDFGLKNAATSWFWKINDCSEWEGQNFF